MTIRETAFPLAGTIVGDDLASEGDGCERLLSSEGLPEDLDRRGRQRMAELAPRLSEIVPATRIRPVRLPMPGGWSLRDPSIAVDPRGFRMIVESSNWSQGGWKAREIHGANGIARTRLFLVELKPDFEVRRIQTIADSSNGSRPARGVADRLVGGRLVVHRGDWWLLAVARPAAGDQERLLLGRLEGSRLKETIALSGDTGPDIWAPVSGEESGSLDFLTSVVPTEVRRFDRETRDMAVVARKPAPPIARQLTIGTQGTPFDGGFLCLLHEAVQGTDGVSRIVHRWVWFDHEWTLSQLSRPFTLREAGMERASGLTRAGDELIVSFGDDDREVWTATLAVADVGALLAPPLAIDPPVVARQRGGPPTVVPAPELAGRRGGSRVEGTDGLSLVSMTMTGSNRDIIGDALRSVVDWVDLCLLIDTGIEDDTIEVARAVVGDKLIVRQYPWHNDFSAARNFSLAAAAETGADWAVTVDSDERIITGDADIRSTLITATEPAFMAPHATGDYTKDRFFRLPVRGEFRGPTHEAFYRVDQFGGATLGIPGVFFDELRKSEERFRQKDERDVAILRQHVAVDPTEPRWFFYMGDALHRLGRVEEAIEAWRACAALRGWEEEAAWALYRTAWSFYDLGRLQEAFDACAEGFSRHAGLGDLAWFAAYLSLKLGKAEQAVYWARISIMFGHFAGSAGSLVRIGWRYPFGLWEGPYDVLRFALRETGDIAGAEEANRLYEEAMAARHAYYAKADP